MPGVSAKPHTIRTVAKKAGVSVATVSRVFSDPERVEQTTRNKVRALAARLHWQPNHLARSLSLGRSSCIGVALSLQGDTLYEGRILEGIARQAQSGGHSVLFFRPDEGPRIKGALQEGGVDGLIFIYPGHLKPDWNFLLPLSPQVVLVNKTHPQFTCALTDYENAMANGVLALPQPLHHLMFIGTQQGNSTATFLSEGFLRSSRSLKCPRVDFFPNSPEAWAEVLSSLERGLGLCLARPHMVFHLAQLMRQRKMNWPLGASLLVFDELPAMNTLDLPLTVIRQNLEGLGEKAADLLLGKLCDPKPPGPHTVVVPALKLKSYGSPGESPGP